MQIHSSICLVIATENRMVLAQGWGRERGEVLVKGCKVPIIRGINFENLIHNMETIGNNDGLYS